MIFSNHIFLHKFHPKKSAISTLIMSSFFRIAAISMLSLFSSIYIFTTAQSLGFSYSNAVYTVLGFYFLLVTTKLIFLFVGQKYSLHRGFKHTIWISLIPFTIFIPLIVLSDKFFLLIPISAIFWGANAGLFWWGYHGFFVKSQKTGHYGQTIGLTIFVHTIAAVIMPVIGALLIDAFGYSSVYLVSYVLIVISLFILGRADDVAQKHDVSFSEVLHDMKDNSKFVYTLITQSISIEAYGIFWQLYLFLLFGSVLDLGLISSATVLLSSFFMIYIGRNIDKHGEEKTVVWASPFLTLSWFARFFVTHIPSILGINAIGSLSGHAIVVSVDEYAYKLADYGHTSPILLLRETGLIIGAWILLAIVAVITYFSIPLKTIFIVVGLITISPALISKIHAEKK